MKDLKGTKTEKNLQEAFAGESQARNKYTYFASKAKKEGYVQIASIFEETAGNEKEHAKIWYKYLHDGKVGSTIENLADAAAGDAGHGLRRLPLCGGFPNGRTDPGSTHQAGRRQDQDPDCA